MATTAIEFKKERSDYVCRLSEYQEVIGGG